MKLVRVLIPLACFVVVTGCKKGERDQGGTAMERDRAAAERERAGEATVTGADVGRAVSNDNAVARIVAARCEREASCQNIGQDKRYASAGACSHEIAGKMQGDLKPSECPGGVDGKQLEECLTAIRKESCRNPIDAISRLAACNTPGLCLDRGERPSGRDEKH